MVEGALAWLRSNAADTVAASHRFALHAQRAEIVDFRGSPKMIRVGAYAFGPFTTDEVRGLAAEYPAEAHERRAIAAMVAEREGRYEDALVEIDANVRRFSELGLRAIQTAPMSVRAEQLRKLGRLEESARAYEEVVALHESFGQTGYLSTTLIELARVRYDLGEPDEAERLAIEGERLGGPADVINFSRGRSLRAIVAADRGDHDQALELARSSYDYAHRTDFPVEHGTAHETLGYVLSRAARRAEARTHYEQALQVWERYGFTAEAVRVRRLLAEL